MFRTTQDYIAKKPMNDDIFIPKETIITNLGEKGNFTMVVPFSWSNPHDRKYRYVTVPKEIVEIV